MKSSKGFALIPILLVVVILIVIGSIAFTGSGPQPFGKHIEAPNEDPIERLAWLSENVDNNDHETFIGLDYEVPSWKELDKMNDTL